LSAVSCQTPRGLPKSVAILARSLLSPIPTEQCSRWREDRGAHLLGERTRVAEVGVPVPAPRNASSQPSTSTTTGTPPHSSERSAAITSADAAL
jgi:hypothetical protein